MGPGNFLEMPNQPDVANFDLTDIIAGQLQVSIKKEASRIISRSQDEIKKDVYEVLNYCDIQSHFFAVKDIDRKSIKY